MSVEIHVIWKCVCLACFNPCQVCNMHLIHAQLNISNPYLVFVLSDSLFAVQRDVHIKCVRFMCIYTWCISCVMSLVWLLCFSWLQTCSGQSNCSGLKSPSLQRMFLYRQIPPSSSQTNPSSLVKRSIWVSFILSLVTKTSFKPSTFTRCLSSLHNQIETM